MSKLSREKAILISSMTVIIILLWGIAERKTISNLIIDIEKRPVTVTVIDQYGDPLHKAQVHLSTYGAGDHPAYLDSMAYTDEDGKVEFHLPFGEYQFVAWYIGDTYYSDPEDSCIVPDCTEGKIIFPIRSVPVTVYDNDLIPQPGVEVKVLEVDSNVVYTQVSDDNGIATFDLPQGYYQIRMDGFGTYYMSLIFYRPYSAISHAMLPNPVEVHVMDAFGNPYSNIEVYVSRNRIDFDPVQQTNSEGIALFALPKEKFRFYVKNNGIKYWSGEEYHCAIPECDSVEIVVNSRVRLYHE